ncbi:MAG: molybdopterin-binding protein [Chloroflexota bacterium]
MRFGPVPLDEATGKILGHNVTGEDGRRLFRKGKPLTEDDIEQLRQAGRETVYVAELEPGDVDEDSAAGRIARGLLGDGLRLSGPSTGRANLYATCLGMVRVDVGRLLRLNRFDGVTLATVQNNAVVNEGKMVATLKILPYAIAQQTVVAAEAICSSGSGLLRLEPLAERTVSLILSGSQSSRDRVVRSFESALHQRLEALGSSLVNVHFVPLNEQADERRLAQKITEEVKRGVDLIILAGETAIMDRHDIAPRAVEQAGGEVAAFGAPVDPGNLLMLAYVGQTPVLGAPGCARSPKDNIVDLVLPRLLIGDRLQHEDIIAFGHGGLLEDVPERPAPRSHLA